MLTQNYQLNFLILRSSRLELFGQPMPGRHYPRGMTGRPSKVASNSSRPRRRKTMFDQEGTL